MQQNITRMKIAKELGNKDEVNGQTPFVSLAELVSYPPLEQNHNRAKSYHNGEAVKENAR